MGLLFTAVGSLAFGLWLAQLSLDSKKIEPADVGGGSLAAGELAVVGERADAGDEGLAAEGGPSSEDAVSANVGSGHQPGDVQAVAVADGAGPLAAGDPAADLPQAAEATSALAVKETPAPAQPAPPSVSQELPPASVPQRAESSRKLIPGRLAYIRCASESRPCPRDRDLESAVWGVLHELPLCAHLAKDGRADIRLHFARGQVPELRFKDFDGPGETLPYGPLAACLEGPLSRMRTALDEESFILSLRFELRQR